MLQHLIIRFPLYYLSSGCLQEVKNKRKFQTFCSNSGCGCLQEVAAYKGSENFGILENLSLRRGCRLLGVVATGCSTVGPIINRSQNIILLCFFQLCSSM